jgi:autotransporter-associated beta strand protein
MGVDRCRWFRGYFFLPIRSFFSFVAPGTTADFFRGVIIKRLPAVELNSGAVTLIDLGSYRDALRSTLMRSILLFTLLTTFPALSYAQWRTLDTFADGEVATNPTWLHNTNRITISTSDAGPGTPTPTTTNTIRLSGSGADTQSITVPNTNATTELEWAYWWGRRAQAATAANAMRFWIYANETNLESGTVDGYVVSFGDDSGGDDLVLQRVDNGVFTTLLTGSSAVNNGLTDIGFCVRVSWSNGNWALYSSTLPTASGGGTNHLADPSVAATVSQGTVSNSTYIPTNGYLGFQFVHSSGGSAVIGAEADQIMVSNKASAVCSASGAITFVQQTNHYTLFTDGGGAYNLGTTNVGLYANSGNKQVAAWRNFRTDGSGGGDPRELQPGDRFRITMRGYSPFGILGFSVNDGAATGSWANRHSNTRGYIECGNSFGDLYVTDANGSPSWSGIKPNNSSVTLVIDVLSSAEFTANVEGQTPKYDLVMRNSPGVTDRIDGFSIYYNDDWNGSANVDAFFAQPTIVTNLGYVEFGADNGTRNINGRISDSTDPACTNTASPNTVRKTGTGTVTIQHATNSYTKGTQIEAGTLAVYHDGNLGTAPGSSVTNVIIWSSGTLRATNSFTLNANRQISLGQVAGPSIDVDSGMTLTYAGVMGGDAEWNKKGSGIFALTGISSTNKGKVNIQNGTLRISGDGSLGAVPSTTVTNIDIWDAGTFEVDGNITLSANRWLTVGTVNGPKYSVTTGNIATNAGRIIGSANWSKVGDGTVVLTGDSSAGFSGGLTVNAGAIRARHNNALGTTASGVTVNSNAALQLQGGITIPSGETLTINSTNSTGALRNISDNNTYAGAITLSTNTRINSDSGTLTLDVASGDAISGTYDLTLGGVGNITVADPIATGSGSLVKDGAGTSMLMGVNSYTGMTTVSNGRLDINGGVISNGSYFVVGNIAGTPASLTVSNNGLIYITTTNFFTIGSEFGANSNSVVVSGGATLSPGGRFNVGRVTNSSFNRLTLSNATLNMRGTLSTGQHPGSTNNMGYVMAGGVVKMNTNFWISQEGERNGWIVNAGVVTNVRTMNVGNLGREHLWIITNGGKVYVDATTPKVAGIGVNDGAVSNTLILTGSGSLLDLGNYSMVYLQVGSTFSTTTGNTLRITDGAVLTNGSIEVTGTSGQALYIENGGLAELRYLQVEDGMSAWITNGAYLYIGSSGIRSNGLITISDSLLGAFTNWSSSSALTLAGSAVTVKAADQGGVGRNITLSGLLSGPANVLKTGDGTLTLTGVTSTASGDIAVMAGKLVQAGTNTSSDVGVGASGYLYGKVWSARFQSRDKSAPERHPTP